MLGSLLGYSLIVLVPLIVLTVKMASAPPHTLLPVITKPLPYTSGYILYPLQKDTCFPHSSNWEAKKVYTL